MKTSAALVTTLLTLAASACGDAPEAATTADAQANASADAPATAPMAMTAVSDADLPTVLVFKSPTCGCCEGWIAHMEAEGFTVDARDVRDIMPVKIDAGVPTAMSSCHTSIIDGYIVEGHVPADQVRRLLAERPDIAGIGAPGMPIGSPGMEGSGAKPYEIYSFDHAGQTAVFATIDPR